MQPVAVNRASPLVSRNTTPPILALVAESAEPSCADRRAPAQLRSRPIFAPSSITAPSASNRLVPSLSRNTSPPISALPKFSATPSLLVSEAPLHRRSPLIFAPYSATAPSASNRLVPSLSRNTSPPISALPKLSATPSLLVSEAPLHWMDLPMIAPKNAVSPSTRAP